MKLQPHLNSDEQELLREICDHEGMHVLLKELNHIVEVMELEVVRCTGDQPDQLVRCKRLAEGARKLYIAAAERFTSLKPKR